MSRRAHGSVLTRQSLAELVEGHLVSPDGNSKLRKHQVQMA